MNSQLFVCNSLTFIAIFAAILQCISLFLLQRYATTVVTAVAKENEAGAERDRMIWMVAILAYGDDLDDSDAG